MAYQWLSMRLNLISSTKIQKYFSLWRMDEKFIKRSLDVCEALETIVRKVVFVLSKDHSIKQIKRKAVNCLCLHKIHIALWWSAIVTIQCRIYCSEVVSRVLHLDVGGFGCDELVLYGIRELAEQHLSTNESRASTFLDQWEWTTTNVF